MVWLTIFSDMVGGSACLIGLAGVAASFRKFSKRPPAPAWQKRLFPLLLILALLLRAEAEYFPAPPFHPVFILLARIMFLGAALLVWPLLRPFALELVQADAGAAKTRLDLARAEARDSRHWLELAEKIARVGHWRYRLAGSQLTWSDEVYSIFGLARKTTPDFAALAMLIVPDDRERATAAFKRAIEHGTSFEISVKIETGGRTAHVTARGVPELDEAGQLIAVFGVFVDITAQKQVEEALKDKHEASETANRALEALARHDGLTLLANRRHFDETIAIEIRRAAREMQPLGLIMIDLDHFKAYNDHFGHPAGDQCLRSVAGAIAGVPQRPGDLVARYGGEEIVVMLPNTNLAGAEVVADLLVEAVQALRLPHPGNPERIVTISCGAAAFEPAQDIHQAARLVERADQALYKAKRAGRNRAMSQAMAA
jgi:diguanylate cyclase (GGDEF)-like protein/PAS domain S-box-containing protein